TERYCPNPHECFSKAKALLRLLPPKWNPTTAPDQDTTIEESDEMNGWETFERKMLTTGTLANIFRIFTSGTTTGGIPDTYPQNTEGRCTTVATDGSCLDNGEDSARAGAGVYYAVDHPKNKSIKVPTTFPQSNQTGELLA
ncbi:hypothetical protein FPV67DRAFT_1355171, partial [Lyophyllum atratum]